MSLKVRLSISIALGCALSLGTMASAAFAKPKVHVLDRQVTKNLDVNAAAFDHDGSVVLAVAGHRQGSGLSRISLANNTERWIDDGEDWTDVSWGTIKGVAIDELERSSSPTTQKVMLSVSCRRTIVLATSGKFRLNHLE
jgi:hypothetical protein